MSLQIYFWQIFWSFAWQEIRPMLEFPTVSFLPFPLGTITYSSKQSEHMRLNSESKQKIWKSLFSCRFWTFLI